MARARPGHEEEDHQVNLFKWAYLSRQKYPELAALFSIPNGTKLAGTPKQRAYQAQRLKNAGMRAGVSDVCLPIARGGYGSLWIEMKRPASPGKPKGVLSDTQREWGELMLKNGNLFQVCYTWEEAKDTILRYLAKSK